jgi:hypothetical protein
MATNIGRLGEDSKRIRNSSPSKLLPAIGSTQMALRIIVALVFLVSFAVMGDVYLYGGYYRLVGWQEFKLASRIVHAEAHRILGMRP